MYPFSPQQSDCPSVVKEASNIVNYFTLKVKQSSQSSASSTARSKARQLSTAARKAGSGAISDNSTLSATVPSSTAFFNFPSLSQRGATLTQLATVLPAPPAHDSALAGLSRSQRLFRIHTGVDPRALEIKMSAEFFLFMELRYNGQWTSFSMNSRKWAVATADYNCRLATLKNADGQPFVPKHPRALMEKLGEVEDKIINKLSTGDYRGMIFCFTCAQIASSYWNTSPKWPRRLLEEALSYCIVGQGREREG